MSRYKGYKPKPKKSRICTECHGPFIAVNGNAITCGPVCRQAKSRRLRAADQTAFKGKKRKAVR